jgi:hypothetical protein
MWAVQSENHWEKEVLWACEMDGGGWTKMRKIASSNRKAKTHMKADNQNLQVYSAERYCSRKGDFGE